MYLKILLILSYVNIICKAPSFVDHKNVNRLKERDPMLYFLPVPMCLLSQVIFKYKHFGAFPFSSASLLAP